MRQRSLRVVQCNYASYKVDSMNSDFQRVNWEPVYNADDVNVALNYFNETVKAIFDRHAHFMVKRLRGKPCPWMHQDLRSAMVDVDKSS